MSSISELIESARYHPALKLIDEQLSSGPATAAILHGRSLALERLGRVDDGLLACESALRLDSDFPPALMTAGALHAQRGERITAKRYFSRLLRLRPDDVVAKHLYASVAGRDFTAPMRGEVVQLFDRYAERFEQHLLGELKYRGHLCLAGAIEGLVPGAAQLSVLDLGCGTGLCGPLFRPLAAVLVGIDLSPRMVARAAECGSYDAVFVADLLYELGCRRSCGLDLLLAADVFGYLGRLEAVLSESLRVLRPKGLIAFTVEALDSTADLRMGPGRRFAYSADYLERVAAPFEIRLLEQQTLRIEEHEPVEGFVVVLEKPAE